MSPCLVPKRSPLGQLEGGTNMVVLEGDQVEQVVLRGPGAGEGPTASAVMGDVIDIARGFNVTTFGVPAAALTQAKPAKTATPAPYYLRMALLDKPGALAKVATVLGNAGISIDRMRQTKHKDNTAPVLIVTHKTTRDALDEALEAMRALDVMAWNRSPCASNPFDAAGGPCAASGAPLMLLTNRTALSFKEFP